MECRILEKRQCEITQGFSSTHYAVDIVGGGHTIDNVLAHTDGKVIWLQTGQKNNRGSHGNASYGNCVKIQHANGYCTLYAHLETVNVSMGQHVTKGQVIGLMGNTGNSYGAHTHFEVRTPSNVKINPTEYLSKDLPGLPTDELKMQGHVENIGWQDWSNSMIGTKGQSLRLEAIRIDAPFQVEASVHMQDIGWKDYGVINKDTVIGTTGESRRLECIRLKGNFEYRGHIQDVGDTGWTKADGISTIGTVGQSLRLEALEFRKLG